ncbi:MAG: hypothetical protein V9H69_08655 [Anaerolineae bacterium]
MLAWLALGGEAGATQVELVDALWPVGWELDGDAERSSLAALRSYLSTLRRVLDPDGPRGSDRFIRHEGERYILRPDEVWVDVWQFEALAGEAEALLRQGREDRGSGLSGSKLLRSMRPQDCCRTSHICPQP